MEEKQYKVIVSERSKRMLGKHLLFIAKVNKEAAAKCKRVIMDAIRSLGTMPQRFPLLESNGILPRRYRRMLAGKRYLILYRIQKDAVYVDYILDCRQDPAWIEDGLF